MSKFKWAEGLGSKVQDQRKLSEFQAGNGIQYFTDPVKYWNLFPAWKILQNVGKYLKSVKICCKV